MNNKLDTKVNKPKHKWTREENIICSYGYLQKHSCEKIQSLLTNISLNSIKMKYQNCLFLDKGPVKNSLKSCSKLHINIWEILNSK